MRFIIVAAFFVLISNAVQAQSSTNKIFIPKYKAKDVKSLMDSSTGPTIINFWATWCGPCVRELKYFDSILSIKKKPVRLVLVSLDFPSAYPKKLTDFIKMHKYNAEVIYLNETDADYFIPVIESKWNGAIPASVFIDNSKHKYEVFNMQLTRQRFSLEVDKLLKD